MIINEISSNGFKTTKWFTIDKFKNPELLNKVKVGDDVSDIVLNTKNYVTSFQIGSGENVLEKPLKSTPKLSPDPINISRNILKGQCLNIAFQNSTINELEFDSEVERRIKKAQDLLIKLEDSDYFNW